ncbi:neuromedin-U [Hippocampus zosterae]|uniref:neuromedin-U n=1 Tax=Hippocampus zosterae TaxID=109293 RepID=UPI00223DE157|nr:neuromedin-U [Hippocampus zosterae]
MSTDQKKQAGSSSRNSSRGGGSSLPKLSGGSASAVGVSLAVLLVLATVPLIHSAPVEPWQATVDQRQPLSQASDILGKICFLMLVQKSKELKGQENNRKGPALQPFLHLVSVLHNRPQRGHSMQLSTTAKRNK